MLFCNKRSVACRRGHPLANVRSLRELITAQRIMTGVRYPVEIEFEK